MPSFEEQIRGERAIRLAREMRETQKARELGPPRMPKMYCTERLRCRRLDCPRCYAIEVSQVHDPNSFDVSDGTVVIENVIVVTAPVFETYYGPNDCVLVQPDPHLDPASKEPDDEA